MPLSDYKDARIIVAHVLVRGTAVDKVRGEIHELLMESRDDFDVFMLTMDHREVELGDLPPTEENIAEMREHGMDGPPLLIDRREGGSGS